MPRKKIAISLDQTTPESLAETANPAVSESVDPVSSDSGKTKPKRSATKKVKPEAEPAVVMPAEPEAPVKKSKRKTLADVVSAVTEAIGSAAASTAEASAKKSRSKKATVVEADPLVEESEAAGLTVLFRSVQGSPVVVETAVTEVVVAPERNRRRAKATPVEEVVAVEPVVASEPIEEDGVLVSFRARDSEAPSKPSTRESRDETGRSPRRGGQDRDRQPVSETPVVEVAPVTAVAEPEFTESSGEGGFTFAFRTPAEVAREGRPTSGGRRENPRGRGSDSESKSDTGRTESRRDSEPRDSDRFEFRRRDNRSAPAVEPAPVVEAEPPAPIVPPAPVIKWTQPMDGPQVVVRNGVALIVRGETIYPPLFFFGGATDERSANVILEEARLAAEAGVHLHSFLLPFVVDESEVEASAASAAFLLKRSVEIDPEAQVMFRIVFEAPRGWQDRFPRGRYRTLDGTPADPSVCDDEFWSVAENCLDRFVRSLRLLPEAKHMLGIHLERGEWFLAEGNGYDNSKAAESKFRDWARTRYNRDEVSLRASWFDGSVRFDTISVPSYQTEVGEEDRFVRSSRKQRRVVDYHLFLSDATVERIGKLAETVKVASEGYFLVGVSYGYTFEWSHPASGHLGLGKLLRTPEVDIIAGPPSYRDREPGGTASFPTPIDSFALNGKLYISEEDYKTSLGDGRDYDDFNPVLKTPQALESVHWRGTGVALAHATGLSWMDLWGQGWLKTHSVWNRASQVRKALVDRIEVPLSDPEVAVFIDERSLAYLVDQNAFALLVQNAREAILRAGVSAGFYLLSDLAHREQFPESRLYIFLNAWDIRPELRAAVKSRLQRDNKVLFWLYSAGLFDGGRESLERVREVTGIALKPQPFHSKTGTTLVNRRHPLSNAFEEKSITGASTLEPSYFAIPEESVVLGEYSDTGLPSFVVKEHDEDPSARWTSVFLGEPVVTASLIRSLAQMAGAHVWDFSGDVVHVRAPFLTVHTSRSGNRTIALPEKNSAYDLVSGVWVANESPNIRYSAVEGTTQTFLVGARLELDHILNLKESEVLKITELPERNANVRLDASGFDVPIMSLGDWMGGNESEEVSDEWFLRPTPVLEENTGQATESAERVGQRRRRGSRDRDRDGNRDRGPRPSVEPFADKPLSSGDDLAVMFRKKS
jgi:hypothetical protein